MRKDYSKLQENSDQAQSANQIQLNKLEKQFKNLRPQNRISHDVTANEKVKQMKDIYLKGKSSANNKFKQKEKLKEKDKDKDRDRDKFFTSKADSKVNADQLIKVLQNGRERRNLRRKKNDQFDQKVEDQVQIKPSFQLLEDFKTRSEFIGGGRNQRNSSQLIKQNQTSANELKIKKVLREMKQQERRQSKLLQQTQWKEIQNLLTSKSEIQSPVNQKQRNKRRNQLQIAKELLTGKVSIIWIFVISGAISEDDKTRITKMYSGLSETSYVVPLCSRSSEIKTFLSVPNSLFKIVADLSNFNEAVKCKTNNKVMQFYVYNDQGQKGIQRALNFKSESRKVKGIFTSLSKIIDRAEEEIENQIQIFQTKKGLSKRNNFKKFPSFIKLSGQDKTYATLYRANLYGAKNMLKKQLWEHYNQFMNLVKQKYGSIDSEKKNIKDYEKLRHFQSDIGMNQARQIIKFYVRQSFYYQILNSMLRTMKTTQEFKPCIFPFYENYHSIKKFYAKDLQENNRKIEAQTLYRGARMRLRDFQSLSPGVFVQMFGFMSTSKSLERAKEFCDRDGYIFIISVPSLTIPRKFDKYDHGFVDINKNGLASKQFSVEEQVLFNALNVFKVTKIEEEGARHLIYMQYGSIFQLLNKDKQTLTPDQKDVLMNYEYCSNMLDRIEDQGDVYLLANQYNDCKDYYQEKLKEGNNENGKYYYKLANVQQQCGQLQQANKNVQISLQLQLQNLDINDREKCLKVFSIHSKNAEISLDQQDYLTADEAITSAIEMLADDNYIQKAKKLRQRGQIKFKKGEIIEAEKDFQASQNIFKNLTSIAADKKKTINRGYYFSFLSLICSSTTQEQLEEERKAKLEEIQSIQQQIKNMEQLINEELIKVNGSLKEVAHYAEDKEKYEICVKKARAYLLDVRSRQTNDPMEKAKLKALEATIQDYLQLAQSQKLLYEAIALVESSEPFNPDVGKYSQILGNLQKKQLQKYTNPKVLMETHLEKGMTPIKYDEVQHSRIYNRCKQNFQKAINVLLYNNKTKSSPEVISLKNQLGELDFYESKFQQSQKTIKEAKEASKETGHSEISKSCLLLSKISYARGELKDAFQNVEEAITTLRTAIVKKQEPKYVIIFESNDIHLQIKLHRAKIFLRQMKHDLSLKDLSQMKAAIEKKIDQKDNHSMLADIYELRAQNLISKNDDFDSEFQRAIKLREKQIGQYNLANAVTYCNYAKYLILMSEFKDAEKNLHKALQIFSCFSEEHPINWLVLYCTGLFKQKQREQKEAIEYISNSLKKVKQKYDRDHITVNKIRLQFAKALHRAGRFQDAIKQFESLEVDLEEGITASQARKQILKQSDDEKITVKRFLYQSLRESYQQINKLDSTNIKLTTIGLTRCEKKMNELKCSYNIKNIQKEQ